MLYTTNKCEIQDESKYTGYPLRTIKMKVGEYSDDTINVITSLKWNELNAGILPVKFSTTKSGKLKLVFDKDRETDLILMGNNFIVPSDATIVVDGTDNYRAGICCAYKIKNGRYFGIFDNENKNIINVFFYKDGKILPSTPKKLIGQGDVFYIKNTFYNRTHEKISPKLYLSDKQDKLVQNLRYENAKEFTQEWGKIDLKNLKNYSGIKYSEFLELGIDFTEILTIPQLANFITTASYEGYSFISQKGNKKNLIEAIKYAMLECKLNFNTVLKSEEEKNIISFFEENKIFTSKNEVDEYIRERKANCEIIKYLDSKFISLNSFMIWLERQEADFLDCKNKMDKKLITKELQNKSIKEFLLSITESEILNFDFKYFRENVAILAYMLTCVGRTKTFSEKVWLKLITKDTVKISQSIWDNWYNTEWCIYFGGEIPEKCATVIGNVERPTLAMKKAVKKLQPEYIHYINQPNIKTEQGY